MQERQLDKGTEAGKRISGSMLGKSEPDQRSVQTRDGKSLLSSPHTNRLVLVLTGVATYVPALVAAPPDGQPLKLWRARYTVVVVSSIINSKPR